MTEKTQPVCFVVMPIEADKLKASPAAEILMREIIRPVLGKMGFTLATTHELPNPGMIGLEAVAHLSNDQLVIANLTGLDSKVMYEVGVRHTNQLPLVVLAEKGTNLPFAIQSEGILFYDRNLADCEGLRRSLQQICERVTDDRTSDNPVHGATKSNAAIGGIGSSKVPPHGIDNPELIAPRRSRTRHPQGYRMPSPPQISSDEIFVDWIEAEGDSSALRHLIDQIGSMGFILAARFINLEENRTRIEFRHLKKTPSTYIVMRYLTREGFRVTDASRESEPFIAETGSE